MPARAVYPPAKCAVSATSSAVCRSSAITPKHQHSYGLRGLFRGDFLGYLRFSRNNSVCVDFALYVDEDQHMLVSFSNRHRRYRGWHLFLSTLNLAGSSIAISVAAGVLRMAHSLGCRFPAPWPVGSDCIGLLGCAPKLDRPTALL